jgi:serine/threonine-protein kinase
VDEARYVLGKRIGEGTSAEVFEAYLIAEDGFRRRVAIKRARGRDWSDVERARFVGEARVASALHHANVAAVLDYGFIDGTPYLVLEHVEGLDLSALRRAANVMPEDVALCIALDVAHALAYVHSASDHHGRPLEIVHRDLSPANVLVSWSGDVKLSDFGVARGTPRRAATQVGTIKGTPAFMAPEQLVAAHLDARADLFGLGCLICFMLTGQSPIERDDQRRRVAAGASPQLSESISEDVRRVLARALAPARHQRHPSAAELAEELGEALLRRLKRDPRTTLINWLARHPLAPNRLGRNMIPELSTTANAAPATTLKIEDTPKTDPPSSRTPSQARAGPATERSALERSARPADPSDDPTLLADDLKDKWSGPKPPAKRPPR